VAATTTVVFFTSLASRMDGIPASRVYVHSSAIRQRCRKVVRKCETAHTILLAGSTDDNNAAKVSRDTPHGKDMDTHSPTNVGERIPYPLIPSAMLLALSGLHQYRIPTVDDTVERDCNEQRTPIERQPHILAPSWRPMVLAVIVGTRRGHRATARGRPFPLTTVVPPLDLVLNWKPWRQVKW
jgi:hypothetical protein